MNRFPDQFLPTPAGGDPEAWAWARAEARRLPPVILAALDPFILRDRIVDYEQHPDHGSRANALVLRAVLDRAVAWQADRIPTRTTPERGQGGGGGR